MDDREGKANEKELVAFLDRWEQSFSLGGRETMRKETASVGKGGESRGYGGPQRDEE